MSGDIMKDAFGHHVWASIRVMDACGSLSPAQLETSVPGTYGSILDTLRHMVGSDSWYLHVMSRRATSLIDPDNSDLQELRSFMQANRQAWMELLASEPDPDEFLTVHHDDGTSTRAPFGIRLAQAVHHGTDHRSQVCTVLTSLGTEPPAIDVWDYGEANGRVEELPSS